MHADFYPRAARLLEKEHHAASVQFKKYSKDRFYVEFGNYSMTASEVLENLLLLGCEELRGLSDPGPQDT